MNLTIIPSIQTTLHRQAQDDRIDALNFTVVRRSLCYAEPKKWTESLLGEVEYRYRNFLRLRALYVRTPIIPSKLVDAFWHSHILDTVAYAKDCDDVFGRYLHHDPMYGVGSESAQKKLASAFKETCQLYRLHFGQDFEFSGTSFCSSGCASCSSSCK